MLSFATSPDINFVVERNPSASLTCAYIRDQVVVTADAGNPTLRVNARPNEVNCAGGYIGG
jgi:hypothetical protein